MEAKKIPDFDGQSKCSSEDSRLLELVGENDHANHVHAGQPGIAGTNVNSHKTNTFCKSTDCFPVNVLPGSQFKLVAGAVDAQCPEDLYHTSSLEAEGGHKTRTSLCSPPGLEVQDKAPESLQRNEILPMTLVKSGARGLSDHRHGPENQSAHPCGQGYSLHRHNTAHQSGDHQHSLHDHCGLDHHHNGDMPQHESHQSHEGFEQIALTVNGMTCSGCGNNLARALTASAGVYHVQVNFVMGKASFKLDTSISTINQVIQSAEKATGFRCIRRSGDDDQTLDLIASIETIDMILGKQVPGIFSVSSLDKKTIRVTYDPLVIGARTLVDRLGLISHGLASPRNDHALSTGRKRVHDQLFKTILAGVLTIPVAVLAWGRTSTDEKSKAIVSLVLATLVQLIAVPDFYIPAFAALFRNHLLEMDMLVVISITAAYTYSVVAFSFRMLGKTLETAEFFETSTLLITFILLGRLVAAIARMRAVSAVSLRSLQTPTAVIIGSGEDHEIDVRLLQFGDKLRVLPHSRVPTDGVIIEGISEVDESMLTGESMPCPKRSGMNIVAGTMNGSGTLIAQIARLPGKNTITDISGLVEEAFESKPRVQDVADRVASLFVPVVSVLAATVFVIWTVIGFKVRSQTTGKVLPTAIIYAVAVLAVSCPCALGLAVPMVLVVAGGIAARKGVIIKSATCTVQARKVTDAVFDKTGTLTEEDLEVVHHQIFMTEPKEALMLTRGLVDGNKHPVSAAVSKFIASFGCDAIFLTDKRVLPGEGVKATAGESVVKAGSPLWTMTASHIEVAKTIEEGLTVLTVTRDEELVAMFALKARLRPDALDVIQELKRRGITVHLVSGDQTAAVESVASHLGIPPTNVLARKSPAEKREYVASLIAQGKTVMFCGDGTNDAVAVAQADVGVQLGGNLSSSDVTRGAADVVLLAGLGGITHLLDVSRSAWRRIVFNFVWAAVYNVLAILLAAGAGVNFRIPPAYAGLGELVSVVPVVLVALSMLISWRRRE